MGYFGSSLGGLPGVGWGGSTMFMPNAYGGYSTIAAGTPAGQEASYQLSGLRNVLGGPGGGRAAAGALLPFMQMQVSPLDAGQRMAQTFGQAGMNFGNLMSQADRFISDTMKKAKKDAEKNKSTEDSSGSENSSYGSGGSSSQQNPLSYLAGIFGQYGGGMGGGSFGSGWGR
jgi:hypothetical protein